MREKKHPQKLWNGVELFYTIQILSIVSLGLLTNNFPNHASVSLIPLKEKDLYDSAVLSRGSLLNRQSFGFVQNLKIWALLSLLRLCFDLGRSIYFISKSAQ